MASADVIMPKMGDGMTEGKLLEWKKQDGESVKEGDPIAEIETDKSAVEISAEENGVFQTLIKAGETVPVGTKIATIGGGKAASSPAAPAKAESKQTVAASSTTTTVAPAPAVVKAPVQSNGTGRIKASPLARKVAAELGVQLAGLTGTGPNGRIIEADVRSAPKSVGKAPVVSTFGQGTRVEFSAIRKIIAKRMVESKTSVPHFYLTAEVDMGRAMDIRAQLNALDDKAKISFNDFIVKAAALALMKVPDVNRIYSNDGYIQPAGAHVGIAVALDDGLIVPVVKDADRKTLRAISAEAKQLIEKARSRKLQPDEYSGGTFTVSNLGSFDIDTFQAIIDPAQGAILAVGTIRKTPVVNDDNSIGIGNRMNLTLSGDHRVMDGASGAKFMMELKRILQNPLLLLDLS